MTFSYYIITHHVYSTIYLYTQTTNVEIEIQRRGKKKKRSRTLATEPTAGLVYSLQDQRHTTRPRRGDKFTPGLGVSFFNVLLISNVEFHVIFATYGRVHQTSYKKTFKLVKHS